MADTSLYDSTTPTVGSLALAHQQIIRVKRNGVYENITGDVNNLLPNPTPITVQREVYGTKGRTSQDVIGYNFAPTFTVEAVRDPVTKAIAQPWLVALIDAAYSEGGLNKVDVQLFDALDPALPAFEGSFSVVVTTPNAGFADKAIYGFTLTNDGVVEQITSPIAGDGSPILESALPSGQPASKNVVVRGYNLDDVTGATIGGVAVDSFTIVDANVLVVEVPAGAAGPAPVVVTNTAGDSTELTYTRGA